MNSLKNIHLILRKEFLINFSSPMAYIVLAALTATFNYLFLSSTLLIGYWSVREVFQNAVFIILMFAPIVSMRLITDERRNKTMELLLSSPITANQIVLGKFLFSLSLFIIMMLLSLPIAIIAELHGGVPWMDLFWKYAGLTLLISALLSIGLAFSAFSDNQITAGVLSLSFSLFLYLSNLILPIISNEPLRSFISELTLVTHYNSFLDGNIDLKDIIYYLFVTVFFLVVSQKIIYVKR